MNLKFWTKVNGYSNLYVQNLYLFNIKRFDIAEARKLITATEHYQIGVHIVTTCILSTYTLNYCFQPSSCIPTADVINLSEL